MIDFSNKIGHRLYYVRDNRIGGGFKVANGIVVRTTAKFCILVNVDGFEKRKSKHLLFESEDEAKLNLVLKIDMMIKEQFNANVFELSKIFSEMIERYPEKFI